MRRGAPAVAEMGLAVTGGLFCLLSQESSLFTRLISPGGLNWDLLAAARLIAAAVILLILLALHRMPVENLLLLLFPLGCLTVLFAQFAPSGTAPAIAEEPGILAHILLSILAYGMPNIAGFQGLLLLPQDHPL